MLSNQKETTKYPKSIILVLSFLLFDLLGVNLVLPIFPSIFKPGNNPITNSDFNLNIYYGVAIALYPIFQIISAPILGHYADKFGRAKVLLFCYSGTFLSYIIMIIGIITNSLSLIFISRILDGFTGGNIFLCQSIISQDSDKESKIRYFGLINIVIGISFILGPLIGGVLSDIRITNINYLIIPFIGSALLISINMITSIKFKHLIITNKITSNNELNEKTDNLIFKLLKSDFKFLLLISFINTMCFSLFSNFYPKFLIDKLGFSPSSIGIIIGYLGVWLAVVTYFLPVLSKNTTSNNLLRFGLLITALSIIALSFTSIERQFLIWIFIPLIAVGYGITTPKIVSLLSDHTDSGNLGKILGINQGIQAFATISPLIGGVLANISQITPVIISGIFLLFAVIIPVSDNFVRLTKV
jgi:MFS transporter, DHA1 family, tetracycline resistance protein